MEQPPRPPKLYVPGPISEDDLPDKLFEDDDALKDPKPQGHRKVRVKSAERPAVPKLTNKAKKAALGPSPTKSKPERAQKTKQPKSKDAAAIKARCDEVIHVQLADPVMFWRDQHSLFAHTDISNIISARLDLADWLALRRTCRAAYLRTSYTKLLKRRTMYLEDKNLDPAIIAKLLKLALYTNYLLYVLEKSPAASGKADLSFLGRPIDDNLRRAVFDKTHSVNAYKATINKLAKEIAAFANVEMVSKMSTELYNNPKFITGCFGIDAGQNDDIFATKYSSDDETATPSPLTSAKTSNVNTGVLIWIIDMNVRGFNGSAHSNLMFILDMARSHGKWSFLEQVKFEDLPRVVVDSWFNGVLSFIGTESCNYIAKKLIRLALPKILRVPRYVRIADLIMPLLGYAPLEGEFWVREEPSA